MRIQHLFLCSLVIFLMADAAHASRYQRARDGKTLIWNSQRGVAQEAVWFGARDVKGYATGEGTLTWYRLNEVVNSYTGKMVDGKLEGMVLKEQAGTRLQAKFANGEKVGDWSEPGSVESRTPTPTATPAPKPKEESPKPIETPPPTQEADILPTPIPVRSPSRSTPTPSPVPTPIATATPTSTPTPTPRPSPTPSPTPMFTPVVTATPTPTPRSTSTPTATPTAPPPQLKSLPSSPMAQPGAKTSRMEEIVEGSAHDSLPLSSPAPALRNALEEAPPPSSSASSAPDSEATGAKSKEEMIADFKKQTESVLAQMRDATDRFHEVNRIGAVSALPVPLTSSVRSLANEASDIRSKFGYEVEFYECGVETATVSGLVAVDQATVNLTQKNAPEARLRLMNFFKRYPQPTHDNQKPLWRYISSILISCNKARTDAENHLQRAKSLESAGKKADALREYQEIYRIYPNSITADKIKLLQQPKQ